MEPPRKSEEQQSSPKWDTSPHTCFNCGSSTTMFPESPPSFDSKSPPGYIPIRVPAVNLPPNTHTNREAIILAPVPQPQQVPIIDLSATTFKIPSKQIQSSDDILRFHSSFSGQNFLGFVASLCQSVRGRKISDPCHLSPTLSAILAILDTLIDFIDSIPPLQQSSRYGNYAYRSWHDRMLASSEEFMIRIGDAAAAATIELAPYFSDSFGNYSRIDYGTGHETNFMAWLYCLARLGVIREQDYQSVVCRVFVKYLDLMRRLQLDYCLEPAGSHGVWGLDDYHFLPFVFGSAQLVGHKYMKPKSIHNQDILDNFAHEYLYLSGIVFIKKMKKGPFAEHSPLLDDISGVAKWEKVNSGLLKMYRAEVLEKVPVMQHFLFGSLIKWE